MSVLQIGTAQAVAGQIAIGKLKVAELADATEINIPVIIVKGQQEGPTLLLSSTIHGPEITGGEIIRQLCRGIVDPAKLRGTIIGLPLCNPFAFYEATWLTPQDGMNLNRAFPGQDDKWLTSYMAKQIFDNAVLKADYFIDFHADCGPCLMRLQIKHGESEEGWQVMQRMCKAFDLPAVRQEGEIVHRNGTLSAAAEEHGIYGICAELGAWRRMDPEAVRVGVQGTLNVMREFGMWEGEFEPQTGVPDVPKSLIWEEFFAQRGGMVRFLKLPGQLVKKDEAFVQIITPVGDLVEEIVSPADAIIVGYPLFRNQAVGTGDMLAFLGIIG